jgi:hypothetical protein
MSLQVENVRKARHSGNMFVIPSSGGWSRVTFIQKFPGREDLNAYGKHVIDILYVINTYLSEFQNDIKYIDNKTKVEKIQSFF